VESKHDIPGSLGEVYLCNISDGKGVPFVVLYEDGDGRRFGLVPTVSLNRYGVPAVRGAFDHRDILGGMCAGLMQLPSNAVRFDPSEEGA
jgi:hypothetical protein